MFGFFFKNKTVASDWWRIFLQRLGLCLVGIVAMCLAVLLWFFSRFCVLFYCASLVFCFGIIYPGMVRFAALFSIVICTSYVQLFILLSSVHFECVFGCVFLVCWHWFWCGFVAVCGFCRCYYLIFTEYIVRVVTIFCYWCFYGAVFLFCFCVQFPAVFACVFRTALVLLQVCFCRCLLLIW